MRTLGVDTAPVELRGIQQWALAQQVVRHFRQKPLQTGTFQDSAAQGIDHGHGASPGDLHQSHHTESRVGPKVQRIGVLSVHPAKHHIDPLEAPQRSHPELAVPHHQIRALNQRESQNCCEIGLVESSLRVNTGAEDHHHWILGCSRRGVDQSQPQRLGERRRRAGRDPLVEFGYRTCHDAAVGQRISRAGWGLSPVGVDLELPVRAPAEIAAVHEQLVSAGVYDPLHGPQISGMTDQQPRRENSGRQ